MANPIIWLAYEMPVRALGEHNAKSNSLSNTIIQPAARN